VAGEAVDQGDDTGDDRGGLGGPELGSQRGDDPPPDVGDPAVPPPEAGDLAPRQRPAVLAHDHHQVRGTEGDLGVGLEQVLERVVGVRRGSDGVIHGDLHPGSDAVVDVDQNLLLGAEVAGDVAGADSGVVADLADAHPVEPPGAEQGEGGGEDALAW